LKANNPAKATVYLDTAISTIKLCGADVSLLKGQPLDVILGGDDISSIVTDIINVCYLFTNQSYTDGNDMLLAHHDHHSWRPGHC
jgi:hypothetical protein